MPFNPTPEQKMILSHDPRQHARVLAGPGTGKSTTMVALLSSLLKNDDSLRLRMLTFTRAAAAELADKISSHTEKVEHPTTIHSFAISILLSNQGIGGFPEPLRIADKWEFNTVVRPTLASRIGINVKLLDSLIQEMASNWESLINKTDPIIKDIDRIHFRGAWNEHRRILGYTLLQELPYALLRALENHEDINGISFDILLVDEYQDLNACDLKIIRLLSEKGGCRIMGAGDDDQSIYSWRKAAPEGIRRFFDDYENALDYPLSVSLRCGKKIIQWANYIIQGDPDRPVDRGVLKPYPSSPDGEVALLRFKGEKSEASGIARLVKGLINKNGVEPKDILVLIRTDHNGMFSNPIRQEIEKLGIKCTDPSYIYSLLADEGNRCLVELLRLLINPKDSISWASILHIMKNVGKSFYQYIYEKAKESGITFAEELLSGYEEEYLGAPSSANRVKNTMDVILPWLEENELPEKKPNEGWGSWIIELAGKNDVLHKPTTEFSELLLKLDKLSEGEQSLERYLGQIEPLGKDLAQAHRARV